MLAALTAHMNCWMGLPDRPGPCRLDLSAAPVGPDVDAHADVIDPHSTPYEPQAIGDGPLDASQPPGTDSSRCSVMPTAPLSGPSSFTRHSRQPAPARPR